MTSTKTYGDFADDLLLTLGVKPTIGNRRALGVIFIIEGRNTYWNPMNWTLPSGYPAYNSIGVKIYPDYATGVIETARNLQTNARWAPFVAALRGARTRHKPLQAIEAIYAGWGSHPNWWGITWKQARDVLREVIPS